jgi:hypothetical protein
MHDVARKDFTPPARKRDLPPHSKCPRALLNVCHETAAFAAVRERFLQTGEPSFFIDLTRLRMNQQRQTRPYQSIFKKTLDRLPRLD